MQRTERQGFVKGCFGEKLVTVRREPAQASVKNLRKCSKTGAGSRRGPKPAPATRPCRTRQCRRLLHRGASSTLLFSVSQETRGRKDQCALCIRLELCGFTRCFKLQRCAEHERGRRPSPGEHGTRSRPQGVSYSYVYAICSE